MTKLGVRRSVAILFVTFLWSLRGAAGGTESFLPAVGRSPTDQASQWKTMVWVHNPNPSASAVRFVLLEPGRDNSSATGRTVTVPSGGTVRFDNALHTLFGVEGLGALRVFADEPLVVNGRVVAGSSGDLPAGGGGLFAAVPASFALAVGERTRICGRPPDASAGGSLRGVTYGLVETTGRPASVRLTAFDPTGSVLGSETVTLGAYEPRFWPAEAALLPSPATPGAQVEVEIVAGAGRVAVFGSGLPGKAPVSGRRPAAAPSSLRAARIDGVTAGAGLSGGGEEGTVTLHLGAGANLVVDADTVRTADQLELDVLLGAIGVNGSTNALVTYAAADAEQGFLSVHDDAGEWRAGFGIGDGAGGAATLGPNGSANVSANYQVSNPNLGSLDLIDDQNDWRAALYVLTAGGGGIDVVGANGELNAHVSENGSNANLGYISLRDHNGERRLGMYTSSTSFSGIVNTFGPNGNDNVELGRLSSDYNHGWIGVFNAAGNVVASISSTEFGGTVLAGNSVSVSDDPQRPGARIVYARLAGPENGLYERGRVRLDRGRGTIVLPEHFASLADPETITVHLTPFSPASSGLAVERVTPASITIGELFDGKGSYEVSYAVYAARRGSGGEPVVMGAEELARRYGIPPATTAIGKTPGESPPAPGDADEEAPVEGGGPGEAAPVAAAGPRSGGSHD